MSRAAFRTSLTLLVLSLAPPALASDPFPDAMRTQLMLPAAPLCTVCHQTLIGGLMTVTKPFGRTLQQRYMLLALDVAGLRQALTRMQQMGDDSDGDGVGDIAELLQGQDPNVPSEGGIVVDDQPRYGCYCSAVGGSPASLMGGAAWLSSLLLSVWRRRRTMYRSAARET
jgi:MYXO-CTERM domain-containing protein